MPRFFNTAGPCNPKDHYTLRSEQRLPGVRDLVDAKLYFVLHAPRQSGKTTACLELAKELTNSGRYAGLLASCETGQTAHDDVEAGVMAVVGAIERAAEVYLDDALRPPKLDHASVEPARRLTHLLTAWSRACPRPVVLFLDEIDALMDASLISVLRQLREGYNSRPGDFPHALALVGLRDVRDYKISYRPERATLGTTSPFNVKVRSLMLRNFTAGEVASLYGQHAEETGQTFTEEACALAYDLTRGQPWLVNALAFQLTWEDVPDRSAPITAAHVLSAKDTLVARRDTHLDSLVDKLREDRVRRVIEPILAGNMLTFDMLEDDVQYVRDLGLISIDGQIEIANPIYREVIPRALAWTLQIRIAQEAAWYTDTEGRLDMGKLFEAFADFWREHAEVLIGHQPYTEAAPHLILLAFFQRVVNGGGFIDREYAVGSGRMDLLLRWPLHDGTMQREAIELKVWRERKADPLEKGKDQLLRYLEKLGLDEGTLVIFDRRSQAEPIAERTTIEQLEYAGKHLRLMRA